MGSAAGKGDDPAVGAAAAELDRLVDPAAKPWVRAGWLDTVPVFDVRLPGSFKACFTTRLGGDSEGVFASCNLDPSSEDEPAAVARNRKRLSEAIGRRLLSPRQVHGVRVAGAAEYLVGEPGSPCDGLTLHPEIDRGLAAALLFADCVPVVLCGEVDMAVAHGGWRGILGGIVQQAGRSMMGAPATIVVGPSLGPCCFEVGEEVALAYARRYGQEVVVEDGAADSGPKVDLWEAVARASVEIGVREEHVVNPRICTACNQALFYSYRAEGPVTGRHACLGWVDGA